jgi:hypothetical protein
VANQCYFDGDFWQCVVATSAGESPATHPGKWRRIQIPKEWRWVLGQLTYAHLLEMDGQMDKANAVRARAQDAPRRGLNDLIRREANRERHLVRPDVQTRN